MTEIEYRVIALEKDVESLQTIHEVYLESEKERAILRGENMRQIKFIERVRIIRELYNKLSPDNTGDIVKDLDAAFRLLNDES